MFGFNPTEWLIISLVAVLLFGNRLPPAARALSKCWREMRQKRSG